MYTQIIQVMDDHFSIETHGDLGIHDLRNHHIWPRRNPPHWISMDPWIGESLQISDHPPKIGENHVDYSCGQIVSYNEKSP